MEQGTNTDRTFRELYCERFHCSPEKFERAILIKGLYPHARMVAFVTIPFTTHLWTAELSIINGLGTHRQFSSAVASAQHVRSDYVRLGTYGILRNWLRFRLSGRKLVALICAAWNVAV